jgi:DNA-binding MarR family transcriptional regulator
MSEPGAPTIAAVRAFNRFYTSQLGMLGDAHLDSALSLTEVRALYEIGHGDAVSPGSLAKSLALDAGYVSRLVAALERRGYIVRTAAKGDARRTVLKATKDGRALLASLERETGKRVATLLRPIGDDDRRRLVAAMATIHDLLVPQPGSPSFLIRDPRPGDIG